MSLLKKSVGYFVIAGWCLLIASKSSAQVNIPVSNVGLAFYNNPSYPNLPDIVIKLGTFAAEDVIPTPFILSPTYDVSALWFCMDPYQYIYYNGYGSGNLVYDSTNPANFDLWSNFAPSYTGPAAPGLTASRKQDIADLFTAYVPSRTSETLGAALQLAIWEIVDEPTGTPFNLSSGQFSATNNSGANAMFTLAQQMLDRINTNDSTFVNKGDVSSLDFLIDGHYQSASGTPTQDLVGYTPVPESNAFALGAVCMLFPYVGRRLLKRKAAATVAA